MMKSATGSSWRQYEAKSFLQSVVVGLYIRETGLGGHRHMMLHLQHKTCSDYMMLMT
jgi:hypothetical protein